MIDPELQDWLVGDYTRRLTGTDGALSWLTIAGLTRRGAYELDDEGGFAIDDAGEPIFKVDANGPLVTPFIGSTLSVDRMGDVLAQDWRLKNYRANPVIFNEHKRSLVVGRGVAKVLTNEKYKQHLGIGVTWDTGDLNPTGQLLAYQHENRFRHAGSVGFRPGKSTSRKELPKESPFHIGDEKIPWWRAGHYYQRNELLEFSSASVPANVTAAQLRSYALETDDPDEQARRFVEGSTSKAQAENILRALEDDDVLLKVRKMLGVTNDPETDQERAAKWLEAIAADPDLLLKHQAMTFCAPQPKPPKPPETTSAIEWLAGGTN